MAVDGRSRLLPHMSQIYTGDMVLVSKTARSNNGVLASYRSRLAHVALRIGKSVLIGNNDLVKDGI